MSTQIWRFPISANKQTEVEMPKDAVILCVQSKDGEPQMWAEVNTDAPKEKRTFEIFGTGHDMVPGVHRKYIGTFQVVGSMLGTLVFHVYERLTHRRKLSRITEICRLIDDFTWKGERHELGRTNGGCVFKGARRRKARPSG